MASRKMTRHGANANSTRRASRTGARRSATPRVRAKPRKDAAPGKKTAAKPRTVTTATPPKRRAAPRTGAPRAAKRPEPPTRRYRGAIVVLVVLSALLALGSFYPVARVQYREERQKAKLEAEYRALVARNDRLSKAVERLRTPEGVEDLARSNLGLVKEGEHAVVVVDPSKETTLAGAPQIDAEPKVAAPRGPWTATLDAFFGYHE